MAKIKPIGS